MRPRGSPTSAAPPYALLKGVEVRIAVSGSIANDYLMNFPGRFSEQIVPEQLERLSLSFLIDRMDVRRGGVAANICFGMGQLGLEPILVGAVGRDFFSDYEPHLAAVGVDTSRVHVSEEHLTAMFLCTDDEVQNQIASFYPGAMNEAVSIDLTDVLGGVEPDLVVVAPNSPDAMHRHTEQALEAGWPVAADPSQQLPRLDGDEVRKLIDGATFLLSNDYEAALIQSKSGWSEEEILRHVGTRITTHGPKGCIVEQRNSPAIKVEAVPPLENAELEPTGVGDAFRSGVLTGLSRGFSIERAAQLGSGIATLALESVGPQEYRPSSNGLLSRIGAAYGDEAAAEIAEVFPDTSG